MQETLETIGNWVETDAVGQDKADREALDFLKQYLTLLTDRMRCLTQVIDLSEEDQQTQNSFYSDLYKEKAKVLADAVTDGNQPFFFP